MPGSCPNVRAVARKAAQRLLIARYVRFSGVGLLVAAAAGLVVVGLDRLLGWGLNEWVVLAGAGAGALAVAGLLALWRRPGLMAAAERLDEVHALHDRLSSALAFDEAAEAAPFARWLLRDAEAEARRVKVGPAAPVVLGWPWGAWPVVGALAVAAALFLPTLASTREGGAAASDPLARETARARIREVAQLAAGEGERAELDDVATREQLAALEDLERELVEGRTDPREAEVKAAEAAGRVAERLRAQSEARERTLERLRDGFAADDATGDAALDDLRQSLREGDFARAAERVRELEERAAESTPGQRRRMAEALQRMAEAAEAAPGESGGARGGEGELEDEAVRRAREALEELGRGTDREELERRLRERGTPGEEASELAERIAQENRQREAQERAQREAESLREAMRQAAREADPTLPEPTAEPPERQPPEGEQPQQDRQPEQPEGERGEHQRRDRDPQSGDGTPEPGQEEADNRQPQQREGGERASQPDRRPQPAEGSEDQPTEQREAAEPGEADRPAPGQQPARGEREGTQGQQRQAEQGQEQQGQQGQGPPDQEQQSQGRQEQRQQPGAGAEGEPQQGPAPGERVEGEQQGPGDEGEGAERTVGGWPGEGGQGAQPGEQPRTGEDGVGAGSPAGGQGDGPGVGDDTGFGRLRRELERLAEEQRDVQRDAQRSEELQRRARQMLEGMSDEQRQELDDLARQIAERRQRPVPPPGALRQRPTEDVDMRAAPQEGARERVVSEWYGQGEAPSDARSRGEMLRDFSSRAAEGAERAVERQDVPPRYNELLRRVYRRMQERASEGGGS